MAVVALLVAVVVSGLPRLAAEFAENADADCSGECSGCDTQGHCPPTCPCAVCGHAVRGVPSVPEVGLTRRMQTAVLAVTTAERLVPRESIDEIFRPPRA